jgi:histidinol-phosphate phosphatase HisN, inositol monophosphatase family
MKTSPPSVEHQPQDATFRALLEFAHLLADRSAEVTLPQFRKTLDIDNKASLEAFDPVTAADRDAEIAISAMVRRRFPLHGLLGEEFGDHNAGARLKWVIDPIDGTRAFITGTPLWGTLIGLLDGEEPRLGIMDQPFTRERFWSEEASAHLRTGAGAVRQLSTRECPRIEDAFLSTTDPDLFATGDEADGFARLKSRARMTRYGGDCYAYCMLAAGFIDLVVECGLKPFDVVALIPIIERSGGRITTWDGKSAAQGGRILAAGDPRLHVAAAKMLAG